GRRQVLAGVDLTVGRGEVVGICGENGSGKSTLMRVLAGLLPADSGEVRRRDTLGYAPQVPLLYDQLSAWEHFHYFAAARGLLRQVWEESARRLLERSEEHTSELQSRGHLVCRLLLEKKKKAKENITLD